MAYDSQLDQLTLIRESYGRRTNPIAPDSSLLLIKPTMQVAHGGGHRMRKSDPAYKVLRQWIAEGCVVDDPASTEIDDHVSTFAAAAMFALDQ